jgi:preprotein translocase subunit SecF
MAKITEKYPESVALRVDYINSSVSNEFKRNSLLAIFSAVVAIMVYIAIVFRKVSRPVVSWKYGLGAVVALIHDILITVGVFSVLGHFYGVEVGIPFVAALLTILGFSVHDTIVVYDRTRENLLRGSAKEKFPDVVNRSLNETLVRSINTSMTVIITLLAIYFFGGESVKYFSLALLVGVTFGTYSSIFIASALLVTSYEWQTSHKNN